MDDTDANYNPGDSTYTFVVRIINPCVWKTFKTEVNYLTASSVSTLYARVLWENSITIDHFDDWASLTYGNQDGYSLCGPRTYEMDQTNPVSAFVSTSKADES